jgi:periplasmic divalent cation tolerance protein
MTDKIVVLVTVGNSQEAVLLAKSLVEKRLAACVNLVPGVSSWYWWEGQVTEDQELLLIMKSSRDKFAELEKEVIRLHSYAVPEVVALQIVEGSQNYMNWIEVSMKEG